MKRREILRLILVAPVAAIIIPKLGKKPKVILFSPDGESAHTYKLGFRVSRELTEDDVYGFRQIWRSQCMNNPLV